jgi:hypothetical protein
MEIITFLGSYLLKAFQNHLTTKAEVRKLEIQAMSRVHDMEQANQKELRTEMRRSPVIAFTASTLAIMAFFAIIVLPKLICVFMPEIAVTYAYLDVSKGFLFFTDDATKMFFKTMKGLTITPIDTHLVAAISGLYFGSVHTRK